MGGAKRAHLVVRPNEHPVNRDTCWCCWCVDYTNPNTQSVLPECTLVFHSEPLQSPGLLPHAGASPSDQESHFPQSHFPNKQRHKSEGEPHYKKKTTGGTTALKDKSLTRLGRPKHLAKMFHLIHFMCLEFPFSASVDSGLSLKKG